MNIRHGWAAVVAVVFLAGCTSFPAYNPDQVPDEQLISLSVAQTEANDLDAGWAIVAINGEEFLIESNLESPAPDGVMLPAGEHVLSITLARGQRNGEAIYIDQEIDIVFSFEEPGGRYQLAREATFFGLGETAIVLRQAGAIPLVMNRNVDEVILELVGTNEWAIQVD